MWRRLDKNILNLHCAVKLIIIIFLHDILSEKNSSLAYNFVFGFVEEPVLPRMGISLLFNR